MQQAQPPRRPLILGVLVSGRGSNLQAIIDEIEAGRLPARIALVVSNQAGAYALKRAERHGITTRVLLRSAFPSRQAQDEAMLSALKEAGVELVVLAGFDQVVGPALLAAYPQRIINVHPALLPAFGGGLHAQADALRHGVKVSGATVHFVTEEVDGGPIILQAAVPVEDDDTEETLSARILEQEHRILPEAIRLIAEDRIEIVGRRVLRRRG